MFKKLFELFLKKFFIANGRAPGTPGEWMSIQDDVVRHINKTKGVPKKDVPPFQGWRPKIVKKSGIEELLEGPVRSEGPKGDRIWDFSKTKKKGEVLDFPKKKKELAHYSKIHQNELHKLKLKTKQQLNDLEKRN